MKTMNLAMVSMLAMGTALTTLGNTKSAYASLTAPTNYDYSYTWNATDSEQYLNANGFDTIPLYDRTADGVYWNYTSTFEVIEGLEVTMTFNRSNTAWQASGTQWKPDENKIGSNSTVGQITGKVNILIVNNTFNDYKFFLDLSSTSGIHYYELFYNSIRYGGFNNAFLMATTTLINTIYLPSYTTLLLNSQGVSTDRYFDAWYLENLGVSEAYQQGYDANRTGILTDYLGTDAQQIGWVLLGIAAIIFVFKGGK